MARFFYYESFLGLVVKWKVHNGDSVLQNLIYIFWSSVVYNLIIWRSLVMELSSWTFLIMSLIIMNTHSHSKQVRARRPPSRSPCCRWSTRSCATPRRSCSRRRANSPCRSSRWCWRSATSWTCSATPASAAPASATTSRSSTTGSTSCPARPAASSTWSTAGKPPKHLFFVYFNKPNRHVSHHQSL